MSGFTELAIDVTGTVEGIAIDWLYASPRLGVTRWDCSHDGQRGLSGERIQPWHVISFVHEGAYELHSRGRAELADSTVVILYNPADPYRSAHPFGCCDYGSTVVVRRDVLLDVMSAHDPAVGQRTGGLFTSSLCRGDLSRVYLRQRQLFRGLVQGEPYDPLGLETTVLEIVGEVVRSASPPKKAFKSGEASRARRQYVLDAQALLQERFREPLRLEDVARSLYVSPYHLCRLFKQETGETIHRHLNRLRLREALGQVADGADLGEVALSVGFSSHSHFTAAFRKEFGVAPSEARQGLSR